MNEDVETLKVKDGDKGKSNEFMSFRIDADKLLKKFGLRLRAC